MSNDVIKNKIDEADLVSEAALKREKERIKTLDKNFFLHQINSSAAMQRIETLLKQYAELENQWRPPGYILGLTLLDLIGASEFEDEWSLEGIAAELLPKNYMNIPEGIDINDKKALSAYCLLKKFIRPNKKPPSSPKKPKPWQNEYDWLYLQRNGKYWGAKTKQEAIDSCVVEVTAVAEEKKYSDASLNRLNQIKKKIRNLLYGGSISAVRVHTFGCNELVDVPTSFWLDDQCMCVFDLEKPTTNIIFEKAQIEALLCKDSAQTEKAKKTRGRPKNTGTIPGDDKKTKKMNELIASGEATSINAAALNVVNKEGVSGASLEGDIKRLSRKYRAQYPC